MRCWKCSGSESGKQLPVGVHMCKTIELDTKDLEILHILSYTSFFLNARNMRGDPRLCAAIG